MAFLKKKSAADDGTLPEILPTHVGFIMDGNGRWAKKRGLPRSLGHVEGGKNFKRIMQYCKDIGIPYASFYVFSTENWKRPKEEIDGILAIMREYLDEVQKHLGDGVRAIFLGDKSVYPEDIRNRMVKLEQDTAHHSQLTVMLACNYGGRDEIAYSARQIAEQVRSGALAPEDITEETIASHLYTAGHPDVDLVIRPSGELRLSNYLIWQCAYAEYYFTDVLWPDFSPEELNKALIDYAGRGRRFGGV
ncbi:MAG: di-trans,poly-cis-decaprenylcistransferase [Ruminococcus sp.]|jgi:undecaprenyl diphosphate synthase|nr:di-trans,poly-cis-decaprenylcistransferase [Ruminococcus sp.]